MRVRRHQGAVAVSVTVGGDVVIIQRPRQRRGQLHAELRAIAGAVHLAGQRFAFAQAANELEADFGRSGIFVPREEAVGVDNPRIVVIVFVPHLGVNFAIAERYGSSAADAPHPVGALLDVGIRGGIQKPIVAPGFIAGDFRGVQEIVAIAIAGINRPEKYWRNAPVIVADKRNINPLVAGGDAELVIMPAEPGFADAGLIGAKFVNQMVIVMGNSALQNAADAEADAIIFRRSIFDAAAVADRILRQARNKIGIMG